MREREPVIKKMPDQETLEQFMEGMHGGEVRVSFNRETGEFERLDKRTNTPSVMPDIKPIVKTEKPSAPNGK